MLTQTHKSSSGEIHHPHHGVCAAVKDAHSLHLILGIESLTEPLYGLLLKASIPMEGFLDLG